MYELFLLIAFIVALGVLFVIALCVIEVVHRVVYHSQHGSSPPYHVMTRILGLTPRERPERPEAPRRRLGN